MKKSKLKVDIVMKYLVFILGSGLVLSGLTSLYYNQTKEQVVFSVIAFLIGALLITLGLVDKKQMIGYDESKEHKVDELDHHNEFHSPTDIFEDKKEDEKNG